MFFGGFFGNFCFFFSVAEPEPIFFWAGPGAGVAFFKAAPAASSRQAKKKSLVLVSNMTLREFFNFLI